MVVCFRLLLPSSIQYPSWPPVLSHSFLHKGIRRRCRQAGKQTNKNEHASNVGHDRGLSTIFLVVVVFTIRKLSCSSFPFCFGERGFPFFPFPLAVVDADRSTKRLALPFDNDEDQEANAKKTFTLLSSATSMNKHSHTSVYYWQQQPPRPNLSSFALPHLVLKHCALPRKGRRVQVTNSSRTTTTTGPFQNERTKLRGQWR